MAQVSKHPSANSSEIRFPVVAACPLLLPPYPCPPARPPTHAMRHASLFEFGEEVRPPHCAHVLRASLARPGPARPSSNMPARQVVTIKARSGNDDEEAADACAPSIARCGVMNKSCNSEIRMLNISDSDES